MAYECGYVFEPRLTRLLAARGKPLLQFGVFDAPRDLAARPRQSQRRSRTCAPLWSFEDYRRRFDICRDYILAGDIYQINLTFPFVGRASGDPLDLYRLLRKRQPVQLGGIVALGGDTILSLSPEKFFTTEGRRIVTRPMKGTAPRGASRSRTPRWRARWRKARRTAPKT